MTDAVIRYESVFSLHKDAEGSSGAWLPGFAEAFSEALEQMEGESSRRLLAGVKMLGEGGHGDVSLDAAIPKFVEKHSQQQQLLLTSALKAEAEIFYSCASRDLSYLHGAFEPYVFNPYIRTLFRPEFNGANSYHIGESGDYIMTQVCFRKFFFFCISELPTAKSSNAIQSTSP